MAINRALIDQMIERYIQAEKEVLAGKTITFEGRSVTMENLGEIRKARQEWERKLTANKRRGRPSYKQARFS